MRSEVAETPESPWGCLYAATQTQVFLLLVCFNNLSVLAALGLRCCMWVLSTCCKAGAALHWPCRPLSLWSTGFSCPVAWDIPRPGTEPMFNR